DVVNNGTITLATPTQLQGSLTNKGTLSVGSATTFIGTITNEGAIKLSENTELAVAGALTEAGGGSISSPGGATVTVYGGSAAFKIGRASCRERVVMLVNGALTYESSGASTIKMEGTGGKLSGNIAAGQHLVLDGHNYG